MPNWLCTHSVLLYFKKCQEWILFYVTDFKSGLHACQPRLFPLLLATKRPFFLLSAASTSSPFSSWSSRTRGSSPPSSGRPSLDSRVRNTTSCFAKVREISRSQRNTKVFLQLLLKTSGTTATLSRSADATIPCSQIRGAIHQFVTDGKFSFRLELADEKSILILAGKVRLCS